MIKISKAIRIPAILAGGLLALAAFATAGQSADAKLTVTVLSSRPDMVSGGDALVEISAPAGTTAATLTAGGRDVSSSLAAGPSPNTWRGLVSGLPVGKTDLVARAGNKSAKIAVTNYPITGPIFSGPHLTPYQCRTEQSGLGKALDANCSVATRTDYFYRSSDAAGTLKPWPTGPRPTDIRNITTIEGKTVPYIVKIESGTINRTIYRIGILDDPATPAKQDGWNGRFAVSFGGGAGANYNQGANQVREGYSDLYLSRGFAYMVATELVNGLHGNAILQGETLAMLKEHFIETYGPPKWTVGTGGSGGAIQQLTITQMYPGLLDGLQPSVSFPDGSLHVPDCGILQRYFAASAQRWPIEKQQAVIGFSAGRGANGQTYSTCQSWDASFVPVSRSNNKRGCGLLKADGTPDLDTPYDKERNPTGPRCSVADLRGAIYGHNPKTGFVYSELDNVGVQYGLGALNDGKITLDEFIDLNEKVGGFNRDGDYVATRQAGEMPAIRAAYKSGLLNHFGGGLPNVPIVNTRGYSDNIGDIHSRERDLVIRERLKRAAGDADNQIIWVSGPAPQAPGAAPAGRGGAAGGQAANVNLSVLSLDIVTRWLDAMAADPAPLNHAKVVRHKPADAVDAYWVGNTRTNEVAGYDPNSGFNQAFPLHTEPRIVAGEPWTVDVIKCRLKPVRARDYKATPTADQLARLKRVFPQGVCDYSKPSAGSTKFGGTWQRF